MTHLPPERRLPAPEQMAEEILTGRPAGSPSRPRWLPALAAAALALVLALGAWLLPLGQDDPPVATPAPSAPSTGSGPTASVPPAEHLRLGQASTFRHFSVTVTEVRRDDAGSTLVRAKVCVLSLPPNPQQSRTRVSWDPWAVSTGEASYPPRRLAAAADPPSPRFPADRTYPVGECARGWIPFATVPAAGQVQLVRYANGLGDTAVWEVPR